MGTENKHWAKEVVQRTKKRDNNVNRRFVIKKINQLTTYIAQDCANISGLQIQVGDYWTQTIEATTKTTAELAAKIVLKNGSYN